MNLFSCALIRRIPRHQPQPLCGRYVVLASGQQSVCHQERARPTTKSTSGMLGPPPGPCATLPMQALEGFWPGPDLCWDVHMDVGVGVSFRKVSTSPGRTRIGEQLGAHRRADDEPNSPASSREEQLLIPAAAGSLDHSARPCRWQ